MAYSDYTEEPSITKVSKINAAALINLIIAELWRDAYRHSRNGELSKWNADLNCIWVELGGDLEEDSKNKGTYPDEKLYDKIEMELAQTGSLGKKKTEGFQAVSKEQLIQTTKQYRILMKKALFLKRLQNKQGKGTAYHDDDEDYMD